MLARKAHRCSKAGMLGMSIALFALAACGPATVAYVSTPPLPTVTAQPSPTATDVPLTIALASPAFKPNSAIPQLYSCHGQNLSPPLTWHGAPVQTVSFALTMEDLSGGDFIHWLLYNVPATTTTLPAGLAPARQLGNGVRQGTNSADMIGYYGPCPAGKVGTTDQYYFTLFALDTMLSLDAGASKQQLLDALQGHVLARGQVVGTFTVG